MANFCHCTTTVTINVWEKIGKKQLAQLVGEGVCQPDIFTKYRINFVKVNKKVTN